MEKSKIEAKLETDRNGMAQIREELFRYAASETGDFLVTDPKTDLLPGPVFTTIEKLERGNPEGILVGKMRGGRHFSFSRKNQPM